MNWTPWARVEGFNFTDIIYEKKRHDTGGLVARLTFNRPAALNAFTGHTLQEMARAFEDATNDALVGVVILTGTGTTAFSSGGDVRWESTQDFQTLFQNREVMPNSLFRKCRKPLIAAVRGYAIGAGNHMAYCCDFTIATQDAIFGQNGPMVGSPAHGWIISYLTSIVGMKKAREIWMLCRRYTASEAMAMGLVNAVVPPEKLEEEVDRWCEEILAKSPTCIQVLKESFDREIDVLHSASGPFGQIVESINPEFMNSEERREGFTSFLEKRIPSFWRKLRPKRPAPVAAPAPQGWQAVNPGVEVFGKRT